MNTEKIKKLIELNEFDQLSDFFSQKEQKEIEAILLTIAYDYDCLLVYTFISSMLQKKETSFWHYVASLVMANSFNHLKYGYNIAFYHAKKAIALSPNNMELKAYALLFYAIPEKLLDKDTATTYARELYDQDRNNNAARLVLGLPLIP